ASLALSCCCRRRTAAGGFPRLLSKRGSPTSRIFIGCSAPGLATPPERSPAARKLRARIDRRLLRVANCELASRRASARESTISAVPICQWRYLRDLLPPDEFLFVLGEFVVEPPDFVSIARLGLTQAAVFEHPTLSLPVQPPVLLHALLLRRRAFASRRRSSGVGAERAAPSTMTRPDESRTIFD